MDISLSVTPVTNYNNFNDSQSSSDKSNSSISEFVRQLKKQSIANITKSCTDDSECSFELQDCLKLNNNKKYKNFNPNGPKDYDILKDPIYTNIIWDSFSAISSSAIQQSTPHKQSTNTATSTIIPKSLLSIYHDRPSGFPILGFPNQLGKRNFIKKTNHMNDLRMEDPYLREIQMAIYDLRRNSGETESFQQPIDYFKSAENYALYNQNFTT